MAKRAGTTNGKKVVRIEKPAEAEQTEAAAAAAPKRGPGRPRKEQAVGNGPSPEQEAETLAALTRLETEGARINNERSTVIKRFEKAGGDAKAIKATARLLADKAAAALYLGNLSRYAANAGIAVAWRDGQAELTDVLSGGSAPARNTAGTRDLAAARAEADGYNSGKGGAVPHDNPFRPGTEEYVHWHDGRDTGQRDREAASGLSDRVAAAAGADASLPGEGKPAGGVPF